MNTQTIVRPTTIGLDDKDPIAHFVCSRCGIQEDGTETAVCGKEIIQGFNSTNPDNRCVVCLELHLTHWTTHEGPLS